MNRSKEYVRFQRYTHIERKKKIIKEQHNYWNYKFDGVLSKGKIHCSCWMCSAKTNVHGPKMSDLRKIEDMNYQVGEYYIGEGSAEEVPEA